MALLLASHNHQRVSYISTQHCLRQLTIPTHFPTIIMTGCSSGKWRYAAPRSPLSSKQQLKASYHGLHSHLPSSENITYPHWRLHKVTFTVSKPALNRQKFCLPHHLRYLSHQYRTNPHHQPSLTINSTCAYRPSTSTQRCTPTHPVPSTSDTAFSLQWSLATK